MPFGGQSTDFTRLTTGGARIRMKAHDRYVRNRWQAQVRTCFIHHGGLDHEWSPVFPSEGKSRTITVAYSTQLDDSVNPRRQLGQARPYEESGGQNCKWHRERNHHSAGEPQPPP